VAPGWGGRPCCPPSGGRSDCEGGATGVSTGAEGAEFTGAVADAAGGGTTGAAEADRGAADGGAEAGATEAGGAADGGATTAASPLFVASAFAGSILSACRCCWRSPRGDRLTGASSVFSDVLSDEPSRAGRSTVFS
jgi:hypothetical protein